MDRHMQHLHSCPLVVQCTFKHMNSMNARADDLHALAQARQNKPSGQVVTAYLPQYVLESFVLERNTLLTHKFWVNECPAKTSELKQGCFMKFVYELCVIGSLRIT